MTSGHLSLDEALERLLVDPDYRQLFLDGQHDLLRLSPDDLKALESVDPTQLVRTAEQTCSDLMKRQYRGSGGLRELFPATTTAWIKAHQDPQLQLLATRFLASDAYRGYREFPHAGLGCCLEEAFYRFCDGHDIGDGATRELEFLGAAIKALALSPNPSFVVPDSVSAVGGGYFAVSARVPEKPVLFATVGGRYIQGEITAFLGDLLQLDDPEEAARKHGVTPAILQASVAQLRGMGLLE